jgi:hypothetical protein
MQRCLGAVFLFTFLAIPLGSADAGGLPDIKIGPKNPMPACATPGRMMDYLRSRNAELNPRYDGIATEYMRTGELLGVRWDYAFYQMIIETGSLSYRRGNRQGDVKPTQNNFAGLGATGGGEGGDSFPTIAAGVRGHLEHLLVYAGEKVANPVADRTRKIQEWGVLTSWQSRFTRPISYADLASQWAPGSNSYAKMLEAVAERFEEFCGKPDPRPELVAEARGQRDGRLAEAVADERPSGSELARRAIVDSKAQDNRFGLGAQAAPKATVPFKMLNSPDVADANDKQLADTARGEVRTEPLAKPKETAKAKDLTAAIKAKSAATSLAPASIVTSSTNSTAKATSLPEKSQRMASAAGSAKQLETLAAGQKCRVWTASYGGQKAMIIRSMVDKVVNYTVLDVNDGSEQREADAFIAAYAKDGKITGQFTTQSQALDKAFELCPEG